MKRALITLGIALTAFAQPAHAQNLAERGDIRAGREFAVVNCSECHVVVPRRGSRWRIGAPPDFLAVANAPGMTKTALFAFLRSPHPTMPNLILADRDANDVITYILSLKNAGRP